MEDVRIQKTKERIKAALVTILQSKAFDRISVTELCAAAKTSRITFYTHYRDKYDLLQQMEEELLEKAAEDFEYRQNEKNRGGDPRQSYYNMLDCILMLFEAHSDFLQQISQRRNPELFYTFYQRVFERVEACIETEAKHLTPRVNSRRFSTFLCNGLWAYIVDCYHEKEELEQIRRETHTLLEGVLQSNIMDPGQASS